MFLDITLCKMQVRIQKGEDAARPKQKLKNKIML